MEDLVSIVTPLYNSEKFIPATIESVLVQTYENWELFIVDDFSSDGSKDIVRQYAEKDRRITFIELKENYGPAYCRNVGIKEAHGKFIAFLDSDDQWLPEKLETQIRYMKNHDYAFTFTAYQKIDEEGNFLGKVMNIPKLVDYQKLLKTCVIGCLTVVYDKSKLGKQYMPDFHKSQDFALWLKILREGNLAYGINKNLALYRMRKNSISRNKFVKAIYQWRVYRQQEKLSLIYSIYYMFYYAYYGFKKLIH